MEARFLSLLLFPPFLLFKPLLPSFSATTLPIHSQILSKSPPSARASSRPTPSSDPYEILDSIDISDLPMDDNTPLGDLPHPSTEVLSLHGDPLDVAPLQTLEPESSFSFDPPTVFTELELDIPRSIRPNTTADHVAQT
nr:hypothetical protein Iba_chr02aCG12530 [Ipomoea batatas]